MKKNLLRYIVLFLLIPLFSCNSDDEYYYQDSTTIEEESSNKPLNVYIADNSESYIVLNVEGVSLKMIKVKGGEFNMGSQNTDISGVNYDVDCNSDVENPVHKVVLSDFLISETEVTNELWNAVIKSENSTEKSALFPKIDISMSDINNFIKKINNSNFYINSLCEEQLTPFTFSLPSEAQWEYAARGGAESKGFKYSGSDNWVDVAWCSENTNNVQEVAKKGANELGLYDMSGNVAEWCLDKCDILSLYSEKLPTENPVYPTGSFYIVRSGSFSSKASDCRVSARSYSVSSCYENIGFRLIIKK